MKVAREVYGRFLGDLGRCCEILLGSSGVLHLPQTSADLLNDWENLNRGEFIPVGVEEIFGISSETVAITDAEK